MTFLNRQQIIVLQLKNLRSLRKQFTPSEIAKRFNLSYTIVLNRLKNYKIKAWKIKWKDTASNVGKKLKVVPAKWDVKNV